MSPNKKKLALLPKEISHILSISEAKAIDLISKAKTHYLERMRTRFSELRLSERLKRTNPFLLRIRGVKTVQEWAQYQVSSVLFASEEEAVGHVLESIAKICHPHSREPLIADDLDFEVENNNNVEGYQVKMSWDCMPMSSRKNLSNTIKKLKKSYGSKGKNFSGIFASCYGKSTTSTPPGQEYISIASREFWKRVGNGNNDYDVKVGEACALLCAEFRESELKPLVEKLVKDLTAAAMALIGNRDGTLDYEKLFRKINK